MINEGRIAIIYARMNPPTVGHERLVDALKSTDAHDRRIYLSASQDDKRNPLLFGYKHSLVKRAFQDVDAIVSEIPQVDFFETIKFVNRLGFSELIVVIGSDRADELKKRLPMYNGRAGMYTFSRIMVEVVERDPNSDAVEGMSATLMRDAAKLGNYETFERGLPTKLRSYAPEIFEKVRQGCVLPSLVSSA